MYKIHDVPDKTSTSKPVHPGETELVKHKEETSGVTDVKSVKEELKWSTDEDEKVKVVESKGDILDLKQHNYTTEQLDYKRLKPEAAIKVEAAENLDIDGQRKSQRPTDGNVKTEIKEVFEQENGGDDELDGKKTWYFAWI